MIEDVEKGICINPEPKGRNITKSELFLGVIALVLWSTFFLVGLLLPTYDLRSAVMDGRIESVSTWLIYFFNIGCAYTLTNILFLAGITAVLGCLTHRWQVSNLVTIVKDDVKSFKSRRIYLSALLRGFFLYLVYISGFIVVSKQDNILNPDFDHYVRIAAIISVLGYIIGYDPNLFTKLMHRVLAATDFVNEKNSTSKLESTIKSINTPDTTEVPEKVSS